MKNKSRIIISKEKKDEMTAAIKRFFLEQRDEEIGDLASNLILHFMIEELAPEFYNQGVYDAYKYMLDKSEDLLAIQL